MIRQRTPSLDISLILAGYVLMHVTFSLLFVRSRKLGGFDRID
jgi:hydroxymethylglutaryl-CoA reductase (NADPH)